MNDCSYSCTSFFLYVVLSFPKAVPRILKSDDVTLVHFTRHWRLITSWPHLVWLADCWACAFVCISATHQSGQMGSWLASWGAWCSPGTFLSSVVVWPVTFISPDWKVAICLCSNTLFLYYHRTAKVCYIYNTCSSSQSMQLLWHLLLWVFKIVWLN